MEQTKSTPQPSSIKSEGNTKALLTYALGWVTGLIFLLTEKEDKFVRFHAAQSLVTFGGLFVITLVPVIGALLAIIVWPLTLVLWIVLMIPGQ